jgi:hypothetical protein
MGTNMDASDYLLMWSFGGILFHVGMLGIMKDEQTKRLFSGFPLVIAYVVISIGVIGVTR